MNRFSHRLPRTKQRGQSTTRREREYRFIDIFNRWIVFFCEDSLNELHRLRERPWRMSSDEECSYSYQTWLANTTCTKNAHRIFRHRGVFLKSLFFSLKREKTLNALQTTRPLFTDVNNHLFGYHCLSWFSLVALKDVMKTTACRNQANSCTFITITFCVEDWRRMLPHQSGWFTPYTRSCYDSYCESTHLLFKCVHVLFWLP